MQGIIQFTRETLRDGSEPISEARLVSPPGRCGLLFSPTASFHARTRAPGRILGGRPGSSRPRILRVGIGRESRMPLVANRWIWLVAATCAAPAWAGSPLE